MRPHFDPGVLCAGVLAVGTLALPASTQGAPVVIPPERAVTVGPPAAAPTPVSTVLPGAFVYGEDRVSLGPLRASELVAAADSESCTSCRSYQPPRIGLTRELSPAEVDAVATGWKPHDLAGGERVWTLAVESPGATGMRLLFEDVQLGDQELTTWAWNGPSELARGPYSGLGPHGSGSFWSPSLPGPVTHVEVRGQARPELSITAVAHYDRAFPGSSLEDTGADQPDDPSHPCHVDVDCPPLTGGLAIARDATGQMNFMSGGSWFVCSGTLVNDLDPSTQVLWFLTAYHCISTQAEANTLEVVWHYQKSSCSAGPPDWYDLERNCGATLLETNPTDGGNDLAFLRLEGDIKPGVAFAGFSSGEPPDGLLFGIHHPKGDVKKITDMSESGLFLCPFAYDHLDYDYFEATEGLTEGGSSGSGLFRSDGVIFGQLTGKCCEAWIGLECEDATCSNQADWRIVYGESAITWPFIDQWILTGGTLHVDKNNTTPPYVGTLADPFPTIGQGAAAAFDGATLSVQAGSYPEVLTLTVGVTVDTKGGAVVVGQ